MLIGADQGNSIIKMERDVTDEQRGRRPLETRFFMKINDFRSISLLAIALAAMISMPALAAAKGPGQTRTDYRKTGRTDCPD
jgi:hypothetical protein